jgi:CRP-like cAMP-binding protein
MTLRIRREAFVDFARQYPDLLIELNQVLSQRLVEAYDKISEVTRNRKPRELRKLYDKLDF